MSDTVQVLLVFAGFALWIAVAAFLLAYIKPDPWAFEAQMMIAMWPGVVTMSPILGVAYLALRLGRRARRRKLEREASEVIPRAEVRR